MDAAGRRLGVGGEQGRRDSAGLHPIAEVLRAEGAIPLDLSGLPKTAVDYVAWQVKVEPELPAPYDWTGRSIERHRAQIRSDALEFREATRADEEALTEWLTSDICPMVLTDEGLRAAMPARCRIKDSSPGQGLRPLRDPDAPEGTDGEGGFGSV